MEKIGGGSKKFSEYAKKGKWGFLGGWGFWCFGKSPILLLEKNNLKRRVKDSKTVVELGLHHTAPLIDNLTNFFSF